ncbi:glycosyltransferase family 2 protein [Paraglaciecola chathamensis]|uniref:glycosyltransferase family 2 protein n=1 Tax=Paraglaciecola chathamensis TaxID=368405 RepID=UPI0027002622|nr:glycosyltransferase family 2 protein [Paraglaciecola chathamensis]MDO6838797.1 glycosyltransferase family 2 protein [Paraglaciecola chathamensis]
MSSTPLDISVIIPAYNCAKSIENALESVFAQNTIPREVIIVDDGSTDGTQQVIAQSEYAARVTYVRQENAGPSKARNHAISLATSTWLAFLDADDLWVHKDKLRLQLELAVQHPEAVLIDSYATVDWHGEREITISRDKNGEVFQQFLYSNVINATSSVLAKRACVNEIGGFVDDLRFGEDRLLWAQLANAGEVHTLPVITVRKFNEEGNLTSKGDKNYHYRLDLVRRLLNLTNVSENELADIWFVNVQDFLRLSFKVNDTSSFLKVFTDTAKHSKKQLWFSKYGVLALYAKTFQTFKPLV